MGSYIGIMEKKVERKVLFRVEGLSRAYSLPQVDIEYGVYGDLIIIFPKPYSVYLRGNIGF